MISIRHPLALATSLAVSVLSGAVSQAGETEATYQLVFNATWSQETHPLDFPANPHFSGLIGGSHNAAVRFWELGALASPGIEAMAETGSKTLLTDEVNAAITAGDAKEVISRAGINPAPGTRTVTFTMSSTHPYLTLVSMIAPSPDWFVGVDALALAEGGVWKDEVLVALYPYDAGTDSGTSYSSPNDDTDPQKPIRDLSNEYPFEGTPPLGTFMITLLSVNGCLADFNDDGLVNTQDVLAFLNAWKAGEPAADINGDGNINTQDVLAFLNLWTRGCA